MTLAFRVVRRSAARERLYAAAARLDAEHAILVTGGASERRRMQQALIKRFRRQGIRTQTCGRTLEVWREHLALRGQSRRGVRVTKRR